MRWGSADGRGRIVEMFWLPMLDASTTEKLCYCKMIQTFAAGGKVRSGKGGF